MKELTPIEFTERLAPIFEHASRESGVSFDANYFFPNWRKLMSMRIARTWENDGCVLGAIFAPDLYSGDMRGLAYFWLALPEARGTGRPIELKEEFEKICVTSGIKKVSMASHMNLTPDKTAHIYAKSGYCLSESVFTKNL